MTGCSGTQFQSSPIHSNSDACKLLSVKPGHNIWTEKKKYNGIKTKQFIAN